MSPWATAEPSAPRTGPGTQQVCSELLGRKPSAPETRPPVLPSRIPAPAVLRHAFLRLTVKSQTLSSHLSSASAWCRAFSKSLNLWGHASAVLTVKQGCFASRCDCERMPGGQQGVWHTEQAQEGAAAIRVLYRNVRREGKREREEKGEKKRLRSVFTGTEARLAPEHPPNMAPARGGECRRAGWTPAHTFPHLQWFPDRVRQRWCPEHSTSPNLGHEFGGTRETGRKSTSSPKSSDCSGSRSGEKLHARVSGS